MASLGLGREMLEEEIGELLDGPRISPTRDVLGLRHVEYKGSDAGVGRKGSEGPLSSPIPHA
ncbi:MAG: hypothetical protein ABI427_07095 [Solirubrobacteraceae bacterium]